MSIESKTMFGWDMDKNLDDFTPVELSSSKFLLYLIERCKIAEAEQEKFKRMFESASVDWNYELEKMKEWKQRAEVAEAKVKELEDKDMELLYGENPLEEEMWERERDLGDKL
jgi:hypothetical protein